MTSSSDEEFERQYKDERERRRQMKPWIKKLHTWGSKGHTSAQELLDICSFFGKDSQYQLYDVLETMPQNIPAKELDIILNWWYNDKDKRNTLNMLLYCHDRRGPEFYMLQRWFDLTKDQQNVILKYNKVTADDVSEKVLEHLILDWKQLEALGNIVKHC